MRGDESGQGMYWCVCFKFWYGSKSFSFRSKDSSKGILPCPPFYWASFCTTSGLPCEEYSRERAGRHATQLDTQVSHNRFLVSVFDISIASAK